VAGIKPTDFSGELVKVLSVAELEKVLSGSNILQKQLIRAVSFDID
jgi:hypothetical protein